MPEVWRASGGGAGQKEMKLHPLRVCFCWAVPALILTLLCLSGGQAGRASCFPTPEKWTEIQASLAKDGNATWGTHNVQCAIMVNASNPPSAGGAGGAPYIWRLTFVPHKFMRDWVVIFTNMSGTEPLPPVPRPVRERKQKSAKNDADVVKGFGGVGFTVRDDQYKIVAQARSKIVWPEARKELSFYSDPNAADPDDAVPRAFAPTHVSFALTGSTFYEMTSEVVDGQPVELFGRHGPMFYITFGHWRFAVLEGLFRIGLAIFDMVLLARFFVSFRRVDVGQRCAEQPWIMALLALAIFGINDVFFFSRIDTMGKWFQPPISVQRTFFSALYLFLALCLSSIVYGSASFNWTDCKRVVALVVMQVRARGPLPHLSIAHRLRFLYRPRPRPHLSPKLPARSASRCRRPPSSAPTPSPPPRCSSTCSASSRWAAGSSTSSRSPPSASARASAARAPSTSPPTSSSPATSSCSPSRSPPSRSHTSS